MYVYFFIKNVVYVQYQVKSIKREDTAWNDWIKSQEIISHSLLTEQTVFCKDTSYI